jgi:long-chain acyl-CoA synthetase
VKFDRAAQVKALVQPVDWVDAGETLSAELIAWCRRQISALSCPRSIEFVRELPRLYDAAPSL